MFVHTYMYADISLNGEGVSCSEEIFNDKLKSGYEAEIELVKGDKLTISKYGGYTVSLNHSKNELKKVAEEKLIMPKRKVSLDFLKIMKNNGTIFGKFLILLLGVI